jgi:CBS domain-containing protein
MHVADAMTRGIDLVDPSATIQEAARKMAEIDVGAVFIGGGEKIVGVLTDRDILVRVVVEGRGPADATVAEVMTEEVVGCRVDDSIEDAFKAMREGQFRRMPVFDGEKPVGVVALSDLAKKIESPEKLAEAVREISEPHRVREEAEEEADAKEGAKDSVSPAAGRA